jgi:hypothetical protein
VGNAFADFDAVAAQCADLRRIIRQKTYACEAQDAKHPHCRQIDALVVVKAKLLVGVDCIESAILQSLGAQLVDEANAPAFMREIKQHAPAFLGDGRDGAAQLVAAVAPQGRQQIARETFRM